ncbi:ACP S-malonyltransferase [Kurthia massiliensis]|uniref:ACP S-malonyltransferase n=1 Tax=Kurthia massiliensis TaxID=1033739 RepID=UPI000288434C|nr:ACP S-malonyltransferase [Kurthia massiliensis]
MTKIAFLFPGQGSQKVGMGEALLQGNYANFYETADALLGYDLSTLMLQGPEEQLTLTYNAQPALLTTGVLVAKQLVDAGIQPDFTIGHSLGEYAALVASGVMTFEDAVQIVHTRGKLMNEAMPAGEGSMAAILALDEQTLGEVTKSVSEELGEVVQMANLNCPGQIVISGTKRAVEVACERAKAAGARRALPLNVSGPFHSELMKPAAEKLRETLANVSLQQATVPVIANVTAQPVTAPDAIADLLVAQLSAPVQFEASIRTLLAQGVDTFIECGPGKVLSGLVKKIDRQATTYCVYDDATLQALVADAKEWAHV